MQEQESDFSEFGGRRVPMLFWTKKMLKKRRGQNTMSEMSHVIPSGVRQGLSLPQCGLFLGFVRRVPEAGNFGGSTKGHQKIAESSSLVSWRTAKGRPRATRPLSSVGSVPGWLGPATFLPQDVAGVEAVRAKAISELLACYSSAGVKRRQTFRRGCRQTGIGWMDG